MTLLQFLLEFFSLFYEPGERNPQGLRNAVSRVDGRNKLHGAIPLKTTHLLCGSSTDNMMANDVAGYWAKNMIKGKQKIADAWFNAGTKAMHGQTSIGETITYWVTGYPECMNDTIANNVAPSPPSPTPGNLTKRDVTVFTP